MCVRPVSLTQVVFNSNLENIKDNNTDEIIYFPRKKISAFLDGRVFELTADADQTESLRCCNETRASPLRTVLMSAQESCGDLARNSVVGFALSACLPACACLLGSRREISENIRSAPSLGLSPARSRAPVISGRSRLSKRIRDFTPMVVLTSFEVFTDTCSAVCSLN